MVSTAWLKVALAAITLLLSCDVVFAQSGPTGFGPRQPVSPSYRGRDSCPERCSIAGPNPSNWSLYHNFDEIQSCTQTVFYEFSLYDQVDNSDTLHRIYACTSYGPDWTNLPNVTNVVPAETVNATYEIGSWPDGTLAADDIRMVTRQMRQYLSNGYGATNDTVILFAQSGNGSAGLYIGKGLQNEGISSFALKTLQDNISYLDTHTGSLAMQLCQPGDDGDHIFGFMATSNATFAPVQNALKFWSNVQCLPLNNTQNVTGPAFLSTPSVISTNATNLTADSMDSTSRIGTKRSLVGKLLPRADCKTIQVVSGDSCASLAQKCGISGADFTKYNSKANFCSTLQPLEHVCCSAGTLPNFAPKPNKDGSCATYTVHNNDNCAGIAAANSLTVDQIGKFNNNTWAWNGCSDLWVGTIICLSSGTPPMPAPVANAVCGPQVPGTTAPPAGTNISTLNPCPLNACCDVFGQCGITSDFCTVTSTGAPGTAKPGTNGCISNCGTKIVRSGAPAVFRNVAYFEGFGLGRSCLYQDISQLDASKYTHLHFAFGTLTSDYQVQVGDVLNTYEFKNFKRIEGTAKILSFGGWAFSTDPSTYSIFRQGVTAANRLTMAKNIASFIIANDLDGVDIDWEYPGAPDIPGIPPADKDDGANYVAFLATLKNLLPGKSVSIAAPASYWYLKGFPIAQISKIVDYIVFMTYDLHGQWDAGNQYSQIGCPTGNCLRSNVNLTETATALAMITKAGVPSNKVVVGVTSYGRSFAMADASCHTEQCFFTGTASDSKAAKGPCTDTAGYIADAEIKAILKNSSRVNQNYVDQKSNTNIVVYDKTQWIGWMSPEIKASRKTLYQSLDMGGATDWASDLEDYNDPPPRSVSWDNFELSIKVGTDPYQEGPRTGNWTSVTCSDRSVEDIRHLTAGERWSMMDGADAWKDVINVWKTYDRGHNSLIFSRSISDTVHGPEMSNCSSLLDLNNCDQTEKCVGSDGAGSGAAGYEIWNSFVIIHEMFSSYHKALYEAAAISIDPALKDFENKFAPVPPPQDNTWLQILLDFIPLGGTAIGGAFFKSYLAKLPYFLAKEGAADALKDSTYAAISTGASIAKDLANGGSAGTWTEEDQDAFSNYMGQVVNAWGNVTEQALANLFDGSDDSISTLTTLISDGKLIEGSVDGAEADPPTGAPADSDSALQVSIAKAFFAYAIPTIWTLSGVHPFIVDSGYDCSTKDPSGLYLDTDTMQATNGCYNGKLYYLVTPNGDAEICTGGCSTCTQDCTANTFSAPPGLDSLNGQSFGGITVSDLIAGAVRTYIQNGNENGGVVADPSDRVTFGNLFNQDVTTPGYIRMPVCSSDMAYKAWDKSHGPSTSAANYPCTLAVNDCGDSTFVDQTSDASPSVTDCLTIAKNIQGTSGEWEVENAVGNQHQLVQYGSCKFGVQGKGKNGNIDFHIGSEDIVDIINQSVKMFGGSGKVGSKGEMSCHGNVKGQDVEWGLY